MFERNKDNGRLRFNRLEFECFVADMFGAVEPITRHDLEWMVEQIVGSTQLVALEYCDEHEELGEWEDVFYK